MKTHAPGFHEYLKTVKLLKVMLDRSPNAGPVRTEVYYNGWPEDPSTLNTADTVLFFSDGQPGDNSPPVPYMTPERMKIVQRAMRRGCGIITIHYTTFITQDFADDIMEWQGGYYERKGSPETRSLIKTIDTDVVPGAPEHPISRGLHPFKFKDEYYYRLKFRENDSRLKPILRVPELSEKPQEQIVAWAVERQGGGRGFSTSTGHFFENWKNENYRKLMMNAIMWTAGAEIPSGGIESHYVEPEAVDQALMIKPIPVLLAAVGDPAGAQLAERNAAIVQALNSETPRFHVKVVPEIEREDLAKFKLIVLSDCDWSDLRLSAKGRERLMQYLKRGGGLSLIHVSGGLPEFEKIGLRTASAIPSSQASSVYQVRVVDPDHAATRNVLAFETTDQFSPDTSALGDTHVLAMAQLKEGGKAQAVAFANSYSKSRIFQTVLGRDTSAILIPGTAQLIRYGSLWAAERK